MLIDEPYGIRKRTWSMLRNVGLIVLGGVQVGSIFNYGCQGGFHKVTVDKDMKWGNCQNGLGEDHPLWARTTSARILRQKYAWQVGGTSKIPLWLSTSGRERGSKRTWDWDMTGQIGKPWESLEAITRILSYLKCRQWVVGF